jgi:hypothetical protein
VQLFLALVVHQSESSLVTATPVENSWCLVDEEMSYNFYSVPMSNGWVEVRSRSHSRSECMLSIMSICSTLLPLRDLQIFTIDNDSSMQRLNKEKKLADKFWSDRARQELQDDGTSTIAWTAASAQSSATAFTSKTSYLRSKLEQLESKLENERIARRKLEQDIQAKSKLCR